MNYVWIIPLLPGVGAALNGLVGIRWFTRRISGALACVVMAAAFVMSAVAFAQLVALPPDERVRAAIKVATWIPQIPLATAHDIGMFSVDWSVRLDPLSAVMLLVVTGVGFLIHLYATGYMKDEPRGGYARFFCYLNLFCLFMLVLVLGGNFLVMFVGWEGVGLCSYLLIGFWYEKKSASDAGKKAFITNRLGDWGFILGMFLVYFTFGSLDFREVATAAAAMPAETASFGALSAICLLLFIGATGKSAQIPLYVWLPDAMEGPTPVSALIHAATMVTAGVYMVARNAVLFLHAPLVMQVVGVVGAFTALMAATIGLVQNDIKRVLAYSTVSQLGYMFLATGVGAFAAAVFHLVTHAFFKALLFLGSGSVIHAMAGEQDMRKMGGLRRYMPVTFVTMMLGSLAIAGIPPLAGFFSKDEIVYRAFVGTRVLWLLAPVTALLTAFYMFRLMLLTFSGAYRGPAWAATASAPAAAQAAVHGAPHPLDSHAHGQADKDDHEVTHGHADADAHGWHGPHESPTAMTVPLMVLAVGAIVAGFVGVPHALGGNNAIEAFLEPSFTAGVNAAGHAAETAPTSNLKALELMFLSSVIAVAGILAARRAYLLEPALPVRVAERWRGVHALLYNKYFVDELYGATVIRATFASARGLFTFDRRVVDGAVNGSASLTQICSWLSHMTDKYVVDGAVNLLAWTAGRGSFLVRRIQTGLVQNYALLMVLGIFTFLTVFLLAR